ncbi:MAG: hypothetical protein B7X38_05555 [Stenotrophomonas sp. 14-69-23]|nr:MAG: hypothetical protein B7X38_05555 [Stenotrophomonas sp. 14-69-23]
MGYAVYLEGGALDAPLLQPQTRAAAPAALEAAPAAAPTRAAPPVRREAPPRLPPEAPATAPQARPASRRGGVRLPDRLQIALLRASGCNPNDPQTRALMDSWPLDELRANPAAKRALWPQLRELRRKQRQ